MDIITKTATMAALVCILAALCPFHTGLDESDGVGKQVVWRDIEHGGFNALFFLLKVYGDARTYNECLAKMEGHQLPQTLAGVLATAESLGCPLQARSLSPEQLDNVRLPAIVHMFGDNLTEGSFLVLLQNHDPRRVLYLNGASATIATMDRESFLRRWSGVVVNVPSRSFWIETGLVLFGVMCGLWLARYHHKG